MSGPRVVTYLDMVKEQEPCPSCGCTTWLVDGDGRGQAWLLCFGNGRDCVETRDLPDGTVMAEVEQDVA